MLQITHLRNSTKNHLIKNIKNITETFQVSLNDIFSHYGFLAVYKSENQIYNIKRQQWLSDPVKGL